MRLTDHERRVLRESVARHFGPEAEVRLFGSRVHDDARGGDIDLLIELPAPCDDVLRKTLAVEVEIQSRIDDPKVDILVTAPSIPELPIHRVAREKSVKL